MSTAQVGSLDGRTTNRVPQEVAIEVARQDGHHPLVARVHELDDKAKPDHWRAAWREKRVTDMASAQTFSLPTVDLKPLFRLRSSVDRTGIQRVSSNRHAAPAGVTVSVAGAVQAREDAVDARGR